MNLTQAVAVTWGRRACVLAFSPAWLALSGLPVAAGPPADGAGLVVVLQPEGNVRDHDVVTTHSGTTVAVWERATRERVRVLAAVRSPGTGWQPAEVLASWQRDGAGGRQAHPRLATGANGTVVAVWSSERQRIARATWREKGGWLPPRRLSGPGEVARDPALVSNDSGQVAVTWLGADARGGSLVRSAVQWGSGWHLTTVGRAGPRGLGVDPARVGIDDAGNVWAAWYRLRPKPPHTGDGLHEAENRSQAARLAVGSDLWTRPHHFGGWEPYIPGDRPTLVVEDDGTAWVHDWAGEWDDPQPGPVWTRAPSGEWVAEDRAPFANHLVANDTGALISWGDGDAHAQDAVHTRQPDGTWTTADFRASIVVLDDAGRAAAVTVREERLVGRLRLGDGSWGPEQVLAENLDRTNDRSDFWLQASASIADDGTVTLLWRTYAQELPGDDPEEGPDLRTVTFSAVPSVD